jgi:hypothetical protein
MTRSVEVKRSKREESTPSKTVATTLGKGLCVGRRLKPLRSKASAYSLDISYPRGIRTNAGTCISNDIGILVFSACQDERLQMKLDID